MKRQEQLQGEQLELFPETLTPAHLLVRRLLEQAAHAREELPEELPEEPPPHLVALSLVPGPEGVAVEVQTLTRDQEELRRILTLVNETIGLFELLTRLDARRRMH